MTSDLIFCGRKNYEQSNAMLLLSLYQELGASGGQNDQIANFDETPPDWRCPCCLRQKRAIARLNARRELWCPLHRHHDHIDVLPDVCTWLAGEELHRRLGGGIVDPHGREAKALHCFLRRFRRFDDELICADCNTAEGRAKGIVGAPDYFSFTPFEIAKFVVPRFRLSTDVVIERAKQVYAWAKPQVDDAAKDASETVSKFISQVVTTRNAAQFIERPAREHRSK